MMEKILPPSNCYLLHYYKVIIIYILHAPLRQRHTNRFNMSLHMIVFTERSLRRNVLSASTLCAASGLPCGSTCHRCFGPTCQTFPKKKNGQMFTTLWLFCHAEFIVKFVPIHHLKRLCSFCTAVWSNNSRKCFKRDEYRQHEKNKNNAGSYSLFRKIMHELIHSGGP